MAALTKYFPLAIVFLVVILVMLFGNFKQPLIIFLILPLSIIGVVVGMLVTGFQFGFFCIAGWLGLLGMIIKTSSYCSMKSICRDAQAYHHLRL